MVEIYLLRHGIAEEAAAGDPDADRALTSEGKEKLRAVLDAAADAGVRPDLIITSPYRRAVQTAEIAADALRCKGDLLQSPALTPDSEPRQVWDEIRLHRDTASLLLAGHEPLFSRVFAYLLGAPSLQVDFKKGALARIDINAFGPQPHGALKWLLTPKLVRDR